MANRNRNYRFIGLESVIRNLAREEIEDTEFVVDDPDDGEVGTDTVSDDITQQSITPEDITGTDQILADTLNIAPKDADGVTLYLNGLAQDQGAGQDYELTGGDLTQIRWLAGTGTAVNLETTDEILVVYEINV